VYPASHIWGAKPVLRLPSRVHVHPACRLSWSARGVQSHAHTAHSLAVQHCTARGACLHRCQRRRMRRQCQRQMVTISQQPARLFQNFPSETACVVIQAIGNQWVHSLPVSASRAELCSDHPPPGKYGCDEQRDFDKCWADFMVAGDFCKRTCGRCQGARRECWHVTSMFSTLLHVLHDVAHCFAPKPDTWCSASTNQGAPLASKGSLRIFAGNCNDIQPPGDYTCAQQRKFGKCDEHYIRDWGYCASTCGRCDSAPLCSRTCTVHHG
jgi:hypothetical protein